MHLILQSLTGNLIRQSFSYFPKSYLDSLKHKQEESIVARFLILKLVEEKYGIKDFLPKVNKNGVPVFENGIFWSISHKKGIVFVAVSKEKIGVDLEIIRERDFSLLDTFSYKEYKKLGGENWENFYRLWTGKEAIIKYNLGKLDDMKDLILTDVLNEKIDIDGMKFDKTLVFSIQKVYCGIKDNLSYSIKL